MVKYLQMYLEMYVDTKNKVQDFYTNWYKNSNYPPLPHFNPEKLILVSLGLVFVLEPFP